MGIKKKKTKTHIFLIVTNIISIANIPSKKDEDIIEACTPKEALEIFIKSIRKRNLHDYNIKQITPQKAEARLTILPPSSTYYLEAEKI